MVGAVEEALFGFGVGRDGAPLRRRCVSRNVVERGVAEADQCDVARPAPLVDAVLVDLGQSLVERVERVLGVILRAEQSLLLGGDREEEYRALRGSLKFGERLGDFEQGGDARSVVNRAVVNLIARQIVVFAQMIPVRCVDDVLVLELRG